MKKLLIFAIVVAALDYLDRHILTFAKETPKPRIQRVSKTLWIAAWKKWMFVSDLKEMNKVLVDAIKQTENYIKQIEAVNKNKPVYKK